MKNKKNKPFDLRLGFALSGFIVAIKQENSFRFQVIAAIVAIALLAIVQPAPVWWALVIIAIVMVLAAELFNTALEVLCDYVQPEHHEVIGKIKDIAAAAVLVTSVGSLIIAVLLLVDLIN
ncbi:MAG: diacylglycerol kinase [Gammaproteobacteria bacterium]|nr:diacylglycerol kinase [Gammaproteobacteria bacterium]